MGTWSVIWWSALGAGGAASAAAAAADWVRTVRRPRRYCPGPRRRAGAVLLPHRWFLGNPCRYDMAGLRPARGGEIRCPECGRAASASRLVRSPSRIRRLRVATGLMLAGIATWCAPVVRHGHWVPFVPTGALVVCRWAWTGATGRPLNTRLEWELDARIRDRRLTAWQEERLVEAFSHELRDDARPANGIRAAWRIVGLGPAGERFLRSALFSEDYQTRQLAAHVLRLELRERPSDELLRVSVEGLGADDLPSNARAVGYLTDHAEAAEPYLAEGLASPDPQRRVRCAWAAAFGGRAALFDRAVPVLTDALRDNHTIDDARRAADALATIGAPARAPVAALLRADDAQQREFAGMILRRLDGADGRENAGAADPLRRIDAVAR